MKTADHQKPDISLSLDRGADSPREPGSLTDHSLLLLLRNGNEDAATQLYLRYAQRLHYFARTKCSGDLARRVDAEDIVQSVFCSFFQGVSQGYYDLPPGEELWKLLLVIALNTIRSKANFHRAAKRDVRLTTDQLTSETWVGTETDETDLTFLRMVIEETLEIMPPDDKQIVVLRIEGYEVAEIAQMSNRSKRTVERVLQEYRRRLGAVLDGEI